MNISPNWSEYFGAVLLNLTANSIGNCQTISQNFCHFGLDFKVPALVLNQSVMPLGKNKFEFLFTFPKIKYKQILDLNVNDTRRKQNTIFGPLKYLKSLFLSNSLAM